MDITWDYANAREYVNRIHHGMPPVLISVAVTGEHQKSDNPGVPVTVQRSRLMKRLRFMPQVHGLFISMPVKPMTQPKARITLPATAKSMR